MKKTAFFSALAGFLFLLIFQCADMPKEDPVLILHKKILTLDTHTDTPSNLITENFDISVRHDGPKESHYKLDIPGMKEGGLDAVFFASFIGQSSRDAEGYRLAREKAQKQIQRIHEVCRQYPDDLALATRPEDAVRLEKEGKIAVYIGMENGYPLAKDISGLKEYFRQGVRYVTLCHVKNNDLCDSSTDDAGAEWHGLSPTGIRAVKEMNRLGILVDVSHISDESFYDVLNETQSPVIASHSCCRALCDVPRNLDDDMLMALKENGGVIQICMVSFYVKHIAPNPKRKAARDSLRTVYGNYYKIKDEAVRRQYLEAYYEIDQRYPSEKATVEEFVNHIDHAVRVAGIDHVGIGTDFDGGAELDGCENVSQLPNITKELVKRGYSQEDIAKIWGGNFMRVFSESRKIAEQMQVLK